MSWKDSLHEDAKIYLLKNYPYRFPNGIANVTNLTEREESSGYCETCFYTEIYTVIDYVNGLGKEDQTDVYLNLADFMNAVIE